MKTIGLWESVEYLTESIDTTNRTVKQFVIRAGQSKNKRYYPETALKEAVVLFENSQTYQNHPTSQEIKDGYGRKVEDLTGWLTDLHYDESAKAIIATRHFTENVAGENTWRIVKQVIENKAPSSLIGGSINALGRGKAQDDGIVMVEAITKVVSVDDVTSPAAGGGFDKLIASDGGIVQTVLDTITFEEWFEARPEFTARIQKEMKLTRQSKAYQEIEAVADRKVKAVEIESDALRETLKTTQAELGDTKALHEATLTELNKARRELLVEKSLNKSRLPVEWRDSLRQQLVESDPEKWGEILANEQIKAKRISKPRIEGVGSRHIHESVSVSSFPFDPRQARNGEDFEAWLQRQNK